MNFLVVIPHYGSNAHLQKLLPSLGAEFPGDDGLLDTSIILPFRYGEIYVHNNNLRNLGFTAACNEGMRYAMNNDYGVVLLLNNDTEVVDVDELFAGIEKEYVANPKTGVIGFKNLSMDDPDFIFHGGTGQAFPAGVHKVGRVSLDQLNVRTLEKWVTGASMAISSGCMLEIGMLDAKMLNYGSDSDYCYRARYAGFDIVYLPIPILHQIGQSANPSDEQARIIRLDMLTFHTKYGNTKWYHELDSELLDVPELPGQDEG